jgi:hypothetical protein
MADKQKKEAEAKREFMRIAKETAIRLLPRFKAAPKRK